MVKMSEVELVLQAADEEPGALNLGPLENIPIGEGREYEAWGRLIAVFRTRENGVYAVQARCSHRDGPLADGIVGGGKVICPLHAFKFDLATGSPLGHDCPALETFQVSVSAAGEILLSL